MTGLTCFVAKSWILALAATGPAMASRNTGPSKNPTVERLLEDFPHWPTLRPGDVAAKRKLMKAVELLAERDTVSLRQGEAAFFAKHKDDLDKWTTLLVVNRYIFAVPGRVQPDEWKVFGGWHIEITGPFEYLAPWSEAADGSLMLSGRLWAYTGPDYRPLEEFDYFLKRFGRRPRRRAP